MYKMAENFTQISFFDFNQSCGMQLDTENDWIKRAELIPWQKLEAMYAKQFPSQIGNVAKPFRMVLGSLIIQTKKQLSDRALVKELKEKPYLQFFIGLPAFQQETPFNPSSLVTFRKRMNAPFMMQANELILDCLQIENDGKALVINDEKENIGTAILDATCAPSNIRFPQDISLLNEARLYLEKIIDWFHKAYAFEKKPRTYRRIAHREYLDFAKSKRPGAKKIRACVRKQLGYVLRDLGYIEQYMSEGYAVSTRFINKYLLICQLYDQQKYMFDNHTHQVPNRIVSLKHPSYDR